jgi:hypothetical protein
MNATGHADAGTKAFNFAVDLPIRTEWSHVDLVRNSILNCFRTVFHDMEGCQRIAMVAGELMENAIKYGQWEVDSRQLRLRLWGVGDKVAVSVENPVDPDSPRLRDLFTMIEWLNKFPTPGEAYRARMLAIAESPNGIGAGSKLGLARIAYEGNCRLVAEMDGDTLRVQSELQLGPPA